MAAYNPKRKTAAGETQEIKFPISAIEGLEEALKNAGGSSSNNSVVGTWKIIDDPAAYNGGLNVSFTSNGNEYTSFSGGGWGPSNYGVYELRYGEMTVYRYNPEEYAGIPHGWLDEAYKTITITEAEGVIESFETWLKENAKPVSSSGDTCFEMPQIRFTNQTPLNDDAINIDNPLKLTIEIVGGGALQVGDALQLCRRKNYNYKVKDQDGAVIKQYKKKKLYCFTEYIVTEEDLNKRFLTLTVTNSTMQEAFALNHTGNMLNQSRTAQRFIRIRRPKGNLQNNDSGQTVDASFSNVIPIWWTYTNGAIKIQ